MDPFDVVIAGGSFAGLAVAQQVRGKVLVVDRDPLGLGQTSACGAPRSIVQTMGAGEAILQMHDALILHTPTAQVSWPLPEPFCTFDYPRFCEAAFARTSATFCHAAVLGRSGTTVRTGLGDVKGRLLVDATGWRAQLVGGPYAAYVNRQMMAFGIETELAFDLEPGLHFYFLPEVGDGYAWAFPSGAGVRFGVLSYLGRSKLRSALEQFLGRFGLRAAAIHGGFLASGLRRPVVDDVFVVGDAAGQCLPLTGEGIRTAVLAGARCGELLQQVLDGDMTFGDAAAAYQAFVTRSRRKFRALLWGNATLLALPLSVVGKLAAWLATPKALRSFLASYLGIFAHTDGRTPGRLERDLAKEPSGE